MQIDRLEQLFPFQNCPYLTVEVSLPLVRRDPPSRSRFSRTSYLPGILEKHQQSRDMFSIQVIEEEKSSEDLEPLSG